MRQIHSAPKITEQTPYCNRTMRARLMPACPQISSAAVYRELSVIGMQWRTLIAVDRAVPRLFPLLEAHMDG